MPKAKKVVRIKITRNKIIFIAIAIVAIAILFSYQSFVPKPIYSIIVNGQQINFRADLREANGIAVYPSEQAIYEELMSKTVKNITIAFKPVNETENKYYVLEGWLLAKLSRAYTDCEPPKFTDTLVVDSYESLVGTPENIIIAMVHPIYSDETAIRLKDHVISLKAKDYKDFDLVTEKLFIIAFNLKL